MPRRNSALSPAVLWGPEVDKYQEERHVVGNPLGSLRTKIIAWSFVPTAIILLQWPWYFHCLPAFTGRWWSNGIKKSPPVGQPLAADLTGYTDLLSSIARIADISQNNRASNRLP